MMHEYEACPSQEQDTISGPVQHPNDQAAIHTTTDDSGVSSIRSSLDSSLTRPDDDGSTTNSDIALASIPRHAPPSIPPEPSYTPSESPTTEKQGSKDRLVQPLLGGYSKWKTLWKLQTLACRAPTRLSSSIHRPNTFVYQMEVYMSLHVCKSPSVMQRWRDTL